jgi:hypothetical protein
MTRPKTIITRADHDSENEGLKNSLNIFISSLLLIMSTKKKCLNSIRQFLHDR